LGHRSPRGRTPPAGYTAFFGDVTLSHGQALQLLRGADYVSIDNGVAVGRITLFEVTLAFFLTFCFNIPLHFSRWSEKFLQIQTKG